MKKEKATFAAGCFWHVEYAFSKLRGVLHVESGYTGGNVKNPTYEQVCTGKTGHVEAVQLLFDPTAIPYEKLLDVFWSLHDPTSHDRQGADVGSQYRAVIFYRNAEQKKAALASKQELERKGIYKKPIATQILPAQTFYRAEEYHQKYFEKHKTMRFLCGIK